jgi:hypothetical protein
MKKVKMLQSDEMVYLFMELSRLLLPFETGPHVHEYLMEFHLPVVGFSDEWFVLHNCC